MKRQIMKSLSTLCVSAMALFAASSLVVSCYDDGALWDAVEDVQNDVKELQTKLEALTSKVDALYTLKFQVTAANELQYSFDGGTTWTSTGVDLTEGCDDVSLVDNGDSVTITVGEQSFTIDKPEEIVFEIRAGKVYFQSEATQNVAIKSSGVEDITVMSYPKGWWAGIASDGTLEITAPDYELTQDSYDPETYEDIPAQYAASGYVKVHACGADGKCMVGKVPVEVTNRTLVVNAYADFASFTVTSNSYYPPTFFYGISKVDEFDADVKSLLADMNSDNYDVYDNYPNNNYYSEETYVETTISELLGSKPAVGEEYVVWAIIMDYQNMPLETEDFVKVYYSPVEVSIKEDETKRNAFNVDVTVDVKGVDSYVAVAFPENYVTDMDYDDDVDADDVEMYLENHKEEMAMALQYGEYYGKYYTESYTGSALNIAEGTGYSATGAYAPDSGVYVLVLPIDGRPVEFYTADDVVVGEFQTSSLVAGGSVDATATQVTKYMGEEFSYEIWDYVEVEVVLDEYSQLGVEVNPSSKDWLAFYFQWLNDEDWALYGSDDELLVDCLLKNYGMTQSDGVEFPYYSVQKTDPATTMHFVAMFVDKDGKYGKLAKVEATTKELVTSEILFSEPYETNLVDGVLKNTQEFKFKPTTDVAASKYKYVWSEVGYYNPFEEMDDAKMAMDIHFGSTASAMYTTVNAEDLVNGYIVIPEHYYGSSYYLAVLPYDEDGNPGESAAIFEYDCEFAIDKVVTDASAFVSEPVVTVNLPAADKYYPEQPYSAVDDEGAFYGYEYQEYYKKNNQYYVVNFDVAPVEGTEVLAVLVNTDSYSAFAGATANVKVAGLYQGQYGFSYYGVTADEPTESSYRYFSNYEDSVAPDVYLAVAWTDADGNYYYKEYALQSEFQKLANKMYLDVHDAFPTPSGKIWGFDWEGFGVPAVWDFGTTEAGVLHIAYDMAAAYEDDTLEGQYMSYNDFKYSVEAVSPTSGVVTVIAVNPYTEEEQTTTFNYENLTSDSCDFATMNLIGEDSVCELVTEEIEIIPNEYAIGGM